MTTQQLKTLNKGDKFCKVKASDGTVTRSVYTYQGYNELAGKYEYFHAHKRRWFESRTGTMIVTTDLNNIP